MSSPLASDGSLACDACVLTKAECPGGLAHCAAGQHCPAQEAVCAMDRAVDDHSRHCCTCGETLKATA